MLKCGVDSYDFIRLDDQNDTEEEDFGVRRRHGTLAGQPPDTTHTK